MFGHRDAHDAECPVWKLVGDPDALDLCNCHLAERILAIEAEAARQQRDLDALANSVGSYEPGILPATTSPEPARSGAAKMRRVDLLSDIRDRDAQTEPVPARRLPLGRRGTIYDHARQQHSDYHLDSDDVAMGDRHTLLTWLREVPRHILDGILAQPETEWPAYTEPETPRPRRR